MVSDMEEHKIESDVNGNNVSSNGSNIKITVQQNGYESKGTISNNNGQSVNSNGCSN